MMIYMYQYQYQLKNYLRTPDGVHGYNMALPNNCASVLKYADSIIKVTRTHTHTHTRTHTHTHTHDYFAPQPVCYTPAEAQLLQGHRHSSGKFVPVYTIN